MTTTVSLDAIQDALDSAGLDDDAVRLGYSGRGMFGRTCFGIVYDDLGQLVEFAAYLGGTDEDTTWLRDVRQDSMGRSAIAYWPRVTVQVVSDVEDPS